MNDPQMDQDPDADSESQIQTAPTCSKRFRPTLRVRSSLALLFQSFPLRDGEITAVQQWIEQRAQAD